MIDPRPISAFKFTQSEYDLYQSGVEIWRDIPDYEGKYMVSDLGNVKSLNYHRQNMEKILKFLSPASGYYQVSLYKNGRCIRYNVHQLVAIAFLNHKPDALKLVINHINFNRLDNKIQNIEIVTNRKNTNHKHIKHSSIYTGVSFDKQSSKWRANIYIDGKLKRLGYFKCEKEASDIYERELAIAISQGK